MKDMAARFTRTIIVGASSGIGAALARQLAAQNCRVALVARREDELAALCEAVNADCSGGVEARAIYAVHDVRDGEAAAALFQDLCRQLGGLDLLIYAAGIQPRIALNEYDWNKDAATVAVNLLGAIAWGNEAAQRFAVAQTGTIVGIASVAGDRGRRGYPAYGASKAGLTTYLESLRNRVGRLGVRVVTIKPGPVDTELTRGMDKLPLLISAEDAARQIIAAAERGTHTAYVPGVWRVLMAVIRAIPSAIFQKLNL